VLRRIFVSEKEEVTGGLKLKQRATSLICSFGLVITGNLFKTDGTVQEQENES
jgi:hypothetical protein